jgi:inorganic pyrophosphatase
VPVFGFGKLEVNGLPTDEPPKIGGFSPMPLRRLLQEAQKFEIQTYKRPKNVKSLQEKNVPFSGLPLKHPYDGNKVLLVTDPCSTNTLYYEFKTEDVTFVEELPSVVNPDGETVTMARLWIRKGRVGVRCTPFLVEDIAVVSDAC